MIPTQVQTNVMAPTIDIAPTQAYNEYSSVALGGESEPTDMANIDYAVGYESVQANDSDFVQVNGNSSLVFKLLQISFLLFFIISLGIVYIYTFTDDKQIAAFEGTVSETFAGTFIADLLPFTPSLDQQTDNTDSEANAEQVDSGASTNNEKETQETNKDEETPDEALVNINENEEGFINNSPYKSSLTTYCKFLQ